MGHKSRLIQAGIKLYFQGDEIELSISTLTTLSTFMDFFFTDLGDILQGQYYTLFTIYK